MEEAMLASSLRPFAAVIALCIPLALPALAQEQAAPAPRDAPLQKTIGQVTLTGPVASLFVLNAHGATLADGKLTLTGVSPSSIAFADRPVRAAGHIETAQFVQKWREGEDQANIDPPNATVSVLGADGSVADAVVTISAPVLEGDNLTFTAAVLEGALGGAAGPAALFIDRGGFRFGGGDFRGGFGGEDHFTNYAHVQDPHAAWYRSDSGNRTVDYDPHNTYYGGGGYDGGYYGHPWAAGAAGLAAGAAIGAGVANRYDYYDGYPYPYGYCGYPPYPPCN
jgi:hypothetical protein